MTEHPEPVPSSLVDGAGVSAALAALGALDVNAILGVALAVMAMTALRVTLQRCDEMLKPAPRAPTKGE